MSEEPIEGRILDDREVNNMRHKENLFDLQRELEETQRRMYQQMRAEAFYKKMGTGMVDRNTLFKG